MKDDVATTDELIDAFLVEKISVDRLIRSFEISDGLERRIPLQESDGAMPFFDRGSQKVRTDKAVCSGNADSSGCHM